MTLYDFYKVARCNDVAEWFVRNDDSAVTYAAERLTSEDMRKLTIKVIIIGDLGNISIHVRGDIK